MTTKPNTITGNQFTCFQKVQILLDLWNSHSGGKNK